MKPGPRHPMFRNGADLEIILPASTAATTASVAAAAIAAATVATTAAAAAVAISSRSSFVHVDGSSAEVFAVGGFDSFSRFLFSDLDKGESLVSNDPDFCYRSIGLEDRPKVLFFGTIGQITYVKRFVSQFNAFFLGCNPNVSARRNKERPKPLT